MKNVYQQDHQNEKLDFQDDVVVTTIQHLIKISEQIGGSEKEQESRWNEIFSCDVWGDIETLDIKFQEQLGF